MEINARRQVGRVLDAERTVPTRRCCALFDGSGIHLKDLLVQLNVDFHVERLRRSPEDVIALFDPVRRERDPLDQLPIVEINSLPHVTPEIPEIVKHLSGLTASGRWLNGLS